MTFLLNYIVLLWFGQIILHVGSPPNKSGPTNDFIKPIMSKATIPLKTNRHVRLKLLNDTNIIMFLFDNQYEIIKKNTRIYLWRHDLSKIVEQRLTYGGKPAQADDVYHLDQTYIAVDRGRRIIFTYNHTNYQFEGANIPVSPEEIEFHPNYPNILLVKEQSSVYLFNTETKEWKTVANNVHKYIWRDDKTTRVYFIETSIKTKEQILYVNNIFVTVIPHRLLPNYHVLEIKKLGSNVVALATLNSESHMFLIDENDIAREMYFPNNLLITNFMVERVLDGHVIISIFEPNQLNVVTLFGGDLINLKFVRLINNIKTKFKKDNWYCIDLEFHPLMKNMIYANQVINNNKNAPIIRTMVTYDLGVRWNTVHVATLLSENNGEPCSSPKCHFYLFTACSRKRRHSAMVNKYAPHIVLSKGIVMLEGQDTQIVGLFMSTDYGYSFNMIQRGAHDPYMINGGSIIITSERYTNSLMYSFDGGLVFHTLDFPDKREETLSIINFPDLLNTKILVFTLISDEITMHVLEFEKVLGESCRISDFILEYAKINGDVACYKGTRYQNYRKKHTLLCKIDDTNLLPATTAKPCVCKPEDFGCSFGFYFRENDCVRDSSHQSKSNNSGEITGCIAGQFTEMESHYQKVYKDGCFGDVSGKSKLNAICKANAYVDTKIVKFGNTLKLFVTSYDILNNFYKIDLDIPATEHFYSFFFDFSDSCMYYVLPNMKLKSICYADRKSPVTSVFLHWPTIYQAEFDYIGANFIILDNSGISLISKYRNLKRLIFPNTPQNTINSFKAYPLLGKIVAHSPKSKNLFVIKFDGSVLYVVEKENVNGFLLGTSTQNVFFWDNESFYEYDTNTFQMKLSEKLQTDKILVDVAIIEENFVYFYKNSIESKDYHFLVNNLMGVFVGYKYDQYHDYCGNPLCNFICIPEDSPKQTSCLCPDGAVMENGICECSPESQKCFDCKPHEFSCGDGTCIPDWKVCDGFSNCFDKRDEANCTIICDSENFKCEPLKKCLDLSLRCNKIDDCPDGSDEKGCTYPILCKSDEFTCDNSKCISKEKVCNNINDCGDHSDESRCHNRKCTNAEFECKSDKTCVPVSAVCDDVFDCADMSDEDNCHSVNRSKNTECPFSCDDNQCLPLEKVCDHFTDCKDYTDELFCNFNPQCSKGYLPCKYSDYCYSSAETCNGIFDCRDGTDEKHCPKSTQCKNSTSFHCLSDPTECVPDNAVCNGYYDCKDGSDELNCQPKKISILMYRHNQNSHEEPYLELSWLGLAYKPGSDSSYSVQLLDSEFHEVARIATKQEHYTFTTLNMCQTYIAIVGHEGLDNSKHENRAIQTMKYTGRFVSKIPKLGAYNQTFISWSNIGSECKFNSYYVECKQKNLVVLKHFTDKSNVTIKSGISSCNIYSCFYPVYDFMCSPALVVYPGAARRKRAIIVAMLISTIILIAAVLIFSAYKFRSTLRRVMVAAFYKQYIPNQTYECISDTFENAMDSESDAFIQ